MMNVKLVIPDNTPAVLSVVKNEGSYQGELFLTLNDNKKYHLNTRSDDFLVDLSKREGQEVSGYISNNCFYFNKTKVKEYENLFDSNRIADLRKTEFGAEVFIGDVVICSVDQKDLPNHLFDYRNNFKVNITNDDNWTIVRYANLHQHTEFSLLDGVIKVKDLAKKVEYCSAVTDHGNMYAVHDFVKEMNKLGKKPIYGTEFYVQTMNGPRPDQSLLKDSDNTEELMFGKTKKQQAEGYSGEHMIVLAKNDIGIQNLFKLSSNSFEAIKSGVSKPHMVISGVSKPHITINDLEKYHEGLIVTSACIAGTLGQSIKSYLYASKNSFVKKLVKENPFFYKDKYTKPENEVDKVAVEVYSYNHKLARDFIEKMLELFGEDFYFELQNHHFDLEDRIMDEIRKIRKEEYPQVKTVVGIDAHYLNKEDAEMHEVWLCRQTQSSMLSDKHMKFVGDGYWVHSSDETVELFKNDLDALEGTLEVMDKISYQPKEFTYHLPHYPLPEGWDDEGKYLYHLIQEGFKNRFKGTPEFKNPEYKKRLRTEYDVIMNMGWPAYFLIVQDYMAYARDNKVAEHLERYFPSSHYDHSKLDPSLIKDYEIYVGAGRGSGAGSLVNYCLGITDINPMPYGLLFERFLNPDRISMPDIDSDFEDSGRQQVIEYCRQKYGADHVAAIVTFGTSKAKDSIKAASRSLYDDYKIGDEICKLIPDTPGIKLKDVLEIPEITQMISKDKRKQKIIDIALKWEGLKTSQSSHPCGVLITDKPIVEYMPEVKLMNNKTGSMDWVTSAEGPMCEELGCLKMDFLGISTLGYMHECIRMIEENTGDVIDYSAIPLNDVEVYKFLSEGNTASVFQLESGMFTSLVDKAYKDLKFRVEEVNKEQDEKKRNELLKELGDEMFNRLVDMNALVRPGPNAYINDYCRNIMDPSLIKYDHPMMEEQLKTTYGFMIYQEQVMHLVRQMAGFSAGQADLIRKSMG